MLDMMYVKYFVFLLHFLTFFWQAQLSQVNMSMMSEDASSHYVLLTWSVAFFVKLISLLKGQGCPQTAVVYYYEHICVNLCSLLF